MQSTPFAHEAHREPRSSQQHSSRQGDNQSCLTLSVYFHYVNDHFAAEPRYAGHSANTPRAELPIGGTGNSANTPRAEPIAEHTKADAAAKSHDNVRYILSKGLSMTAWQPYPPLFWRAQIEDSM